MPWTDDPASVRPMLATAADAPLDSASFAYEPKYDGIRALVSLLPCPTPSVRFWSRLGNEKTRQFPEIARALHAWTAALDRPVLVDGEIVALDGRGEPVGFQNLQGRIHVKDAAGEPQARVALVAFDILRDGDEDLRGLVLSERRARLEQLLRTSADPLIRISEQVVGDGRALFQRAHEQGWEGLLAKRLDCPYQSGRRSPHWVKLKLVRHQTCVVAGWTEPRGSRPCFGALLLGVYDEHGDLQYVGHSGAGFSDAELARVWKRLLPLETPTSPFPRAPKTNEPAHWVRPELVAEVKFTEWTADGKLRHPTYLGMRDDVEARQVRKEPEGAARKMAVRGKAGAGRRVGRDRSDAPARAAAGRVLSEPLPALLDPAALLNQIDAIEHGPGGGVLDLPDGERLEVSNLGKPFWPRLKLTKGDLFRHYVRVAPYLLPALADRPLVMKRYPNGVAAKPFYQHRAPDTLPPGVRVAEVESETEKRAHIVGGDLKTLLYTAQLASISQDPWFARVGSVEFIDHVAIDLDPPDGLPFARVLDVARWVHDELDALGAPAFPKTSGSGGLHVYVPMPPKTPFDAGLLFCQIVATLVARKHARQATVERSIAARGGRIYVDYMQNARGKTLASVYSPRANDFAGVSTPLTWEEVEAGVTPQDFTIPTFAARLNAVGDLWAAFRKAEGAKLEAVMRYVDAPAETTKGTKATKTAKATKTTGPRNGSV
jgi:bifunctional non-homologous end joining protein LigD